MLNGFHHSPPIVVAPMVMGVVLDFENLKKMVNLLIIS